VVELQDALAAVIQLAAMTGEATQAGQIPSDRCRAPTGSPAFDRVVRWNHWQHAQAQSGPGHPRGHGRSKIMM
jgi:hypothetical protein